MVQVDDLECTCSRLHLFIHKRRLELWSLAMWVECVYFSCEIVNTFLLSLRRRVVEPTRFSRAFFRPSYNFAIGVKAAPLTNLSLPSADDAGFSCCNRPKLGRLIVVLPIAVKTKIFPNNIEMAHWPMLQAKN